MVRRGWRQEECFLSAAFWEITKSTGERQLPLRWQNTHKFQPNCFTNSGNIIPVLRLGEEGIEVSFKMEIFHNCWVVVQMKPFSPNWISMLMSMSFFSCRPPYQPSCRPPQCRLDADRMEIRKCYGQTDDGRRTYRGRCLSGSPTHTTFKSVGESDSR